MVGITSYGAYVPMWRLPFAAIAGGGRKAQGGGGGERSVAYFDEDSVTMAVAAAMDCLRGIDRRQVGGLLFASTSYPYKEKQGSSIIAKALDLERSIITADFGGSLRAGTTALRSALDGNVGDGAAALLIGDADVAAAVEAQHALADEIIDVWRLDKDPFVHTWEDRFVVEHGYRNVMIEAVQGLFEQAG